MWAQIIFDALLVIILAIGLIIGLKNGLIKLVFKKLKGLASLVIALLLSKPVSKLFVERLIEPIKQLLTKYIGEATGIESGSDISVKIPTVLKSLANLFGVDLTIYANDAVEGGGNFIDAFAQNAAVPVANAVAMVGAFIALFIVSLIVLWLVGLIVNAVFQLPLLKQINMIAGALVGIVFFSVIAWATGELLIFGITLLPDVQFFAEFDIAETFIGKFFHETYNPLKWLLSF